MTKKGFLAMDAIMQEKLFWMPIHWEHSRYVPQDQDLREFEENFSPNPATFVMQSSNFISLNYQS